MEIEFDKKWILVGYTVYNGYLFVRLMIKLIS